MASNSRSAWSSRPPLANNPSIILPGTNVTLQVVQGNIIEHKVDAIVNTSNEELELRAGGVSGCIEQRGGYSIQQDMNAIRRNLPRNMLPTGQAVTTGAGKLFNCRKIIHVAGPIWSRYSNREASTLVKKSTNSCLSEADKHSLKSIAIPAISCGVFGGQPGITAKLIVEAITEYFRETPRTSLTQVDLIELSNYQLVREFSTQINALTSQTSFKRQSSSSRETRQSGSIKQQPPRLDDSTDDVVVVVEEGSAISCEADVLVNTAGPNFNLSLSKLSQDVVREGGPGVEHACHRKPKFKNKQFAIAGSGTLRFKYIAHLIVPSSQQEIDQLRLVLLEIFKKIDSYELRSIALPAIGTGNGCMTAHGSMMMIKSAIEMFIQTNPKHLKTIKVVVFKPRLMREFEQLRKLRSTQDFSSFREPAPSSSSQATSSHGYSNKPKPSLTLVICSLSKEINEKVKKQIEWKYEVKFSEKQIDNVSVNSDIQTYLNKYEIEDSVIIKLKNDEIHVCGLQEDVKKACDKIRKLIDLKKE